MCPDICILRHMMHLTCVARHICPHTFVSPAICVSRHASPDLCFPRYIAPQTYSTDICVPRHTCPQTYVWPDLAAFAGTLRAQLVWIRRAGDLQGTLLNKHVPALLVLIVFAHVDPNKIVSPLSWFQKCSQVSCGHSTGGQGLTMLVGDYDMRSRL